MNQRTRVLVAATAALALSLTAACGGDGDDSSSGSKAKPEFNAAVDKIFNPSDKKGGTIRLANAGDWDSLDPGDTYYGYSWDFLRLYGRSLLTFKPSAGQDGNELIPDLAENLGETKDNGKTWTYKLRKGVKYEDGTEVKAADVKYAVLRSLDKETFPNGPDYFRQFLNLPEGYKGPYKSKGVNTDSAITTPDDSTVVFHLKQAFGGFDYLAALTQTVPVPESKDKGANYKQHVISTGPYMFDQNNLGKNFTLKRNPNWDQGTDPFRKALPDAFEVSLNVNPDDIDNRLLSGDLDIDVVGTGVQPATLGRVVGDPTAKAGTDNPYQSRLWYTSIVGTVKPLDNIDCRKAVLYAADRTGYQTAFGGPLAGGDLASTIMPPTIPGYQKYDLYPAGPDNTGDVAKAKEALAACGQPNGFETNIAYRAERPKEKATAESLQQSLARVGIKLTLKPFPQGDYFSQYAGNPPYVKANNIGLATNGWGADWNDGFGYLSQIVDSRVIRETGGSSNVSVRDPQVDKMLDEALGLTDAKAREAKWGEIDRKVMEDAFILPGVYAKALLIRPKKLTNVYVNPAYNMYDYVALGVA
ncbi:peptide ABC transporter substrate-binding protein [Actinoplanes sp. NBRC 14428]|uniref:Peptide/nickel transport system substrate-binding protein n=1 Tax=Pseudosporangium ferrugineum TaxID=439699 RepID=A0A2T0S6D4_9ACTN|nr:ABC transporter substrate-binding protein [Pseudosporangium ferrugineum]PRY28965.1 peptide/nickel transport system substrate-binding protein [Pseudosporangium ferrugineum]BCJ53570.1 peptide ABC transporter substrate-binding protein [Actinoplanes sp. NBRC 14428]